MEEMTAEVEQLTEIVRMLWWIALWLFVRCIIAVCSD